MRRVDADGLFEADRFGIKPLYFARRGKAFAFASEVRALLATGPMIEGVDMLGAGCVMRVSGLNDEGISNFGFRISDLTSKAGATMRLGLLALICD